MSQFHKASEHADVMPMSDWLTYVNAGAFVPSDGCGYWAKLIGDTVMESHDDCFKAAPDWATHVCWYNK